MLMMNEGVLLLMSGALLGGAALLGRTWFVRRTRPAGLAPAAPPQSPASPTPDAGAGTCVLHAIMPEFLELAEDVGREPNPWATLDQLIREKLAACLRAGRVRCYRVVPGSNALWPLGWSPPREEAPTVAASDDILAHVASVGREYCATDANQGPLLRELAARSTTSWTWAWPVRVEGVVQGVVALHELQDPAALRPEIRTAIRQLVTCCWRSVSYVEQLVIARRTDPATGGLTRQDFQVAAERVLAQSYAEHEPVVLVALAIEGLRGLDDAGCWRQRDALLARLGLTLAARTRSDDLMGRFSDDRFVILLRRLDRSLGRLIAEKLLSAADECARELGPLAERIRFRGGIVSSHPTRPPLSDLLAAALAAVERARQERCRLWVSDAPASPGIAPGVSGAAGVSKTLPSALEDGSR